MRKLLGTFRKCFWALPQGSGYPHSLFIKNFY